MGAWILAAGIPAARIWKAFFAPIAYEKLHLKRPSDMSIRGLFVFTPHCCCQLKSVDIHIFNMTKTGYENATEDDLDAYKITLYGHRLNPTGGARQMHGKVSQREFNLLATRCCVAAAIHIHKMLCVVVIDLGDKKSPRNRRDRRAFCGYSRLALPVGLERVGEVECDHKVCWLIQVDRKLNIAQLFATLVMGW